MKTLSFTLLIMCFSTLIYADCGSNEPASQVRTRPPQSKVQMKTRTTADFVDRASALLACLSGSFSFYQKDAGTAGELKKGLMKTYKSSAYLIIQEFSWEDGSGGQLIMGIDALKEQLYVIPINDRASLPKIATGKLDPQKAKITFKQDSKELKQLIIEVSGKNKYTVTKERDSLFRSKQVFTRID